MFAAVRTLSIQIFQGFSSAVEFRSKSTAMNNTDSKSRQKNFLLCKDVGPSA